MPSNDERVTRAFALLIVFWPGIVVLCFDLLVPLNMTVLVPLFITAHSLSAVVAAIILELRNRYDRLLEMPSALLPTAIAHPGN